MIGGVDFTYFSFVSPCIMKTRLPWMDCVLDSDTLKDGIGGLAGRI
jgi:hypothetical protein